MSEIEKIEIEKPQGQTTPKVVAWVGCGLLAACVAGAGWMAFGGKSGETGGLSSSPISSANAATGTGSKGGLDPNAANILVAKVDGHEVTELEISNLTSNGVDRAIAVDRYINKVIAAEQGRKLYEKESLSLTRAAEREVLATLYTTKRLDELRKAVTQDEIKEFYTKNVLDENFKQWKVSYYLTTEPKDMDSTLQKMKDGDKDALKELKPLAEQGDNYLAAQAMPYNLGRVVSRVKKGEFSEVLRLRNGFLVVRVDDMRQQEKPKLEALKNDIIETLAQQKFNEELTRARRAAKVELG
ncbi:MAG: peptidylprolyl isomerase [Limnobacter sp.]|nr:peptidylprolyl isomerase [Limnobacter sp.]